MSLAKPVVEWMLVLCDLDGVPLQRITKLAAELKFDFPLNRPASCSFNVPAAHPSVAILHTDGYPFLWCSNRVIKAYRKESGTWVIRFAGTIEHMEPIGDGDTLRTSVTAWDPMALLVLRPVLDHATVDYPAAGGKYAPGSTATNLLAKRLVADWNAYDAPNSETGIRTASGTFNTTASRAPEWERGRTTYAALGELTDAGDLDLAFDPVDRTDGKLVEMSVLTERGAEVDAVFSYAQTTGSSRKHSNTASMGLELDGLQMANVVIRDSGAGGRTAGTPQTDATSISKFRYRVAMPVSVQAPAAFADVLAAQQLLLEANPRLLLTFAPAPELAPAPFTSYFLGDRVHANFLPYVSGLCRIYRIELAVEKNRYERVTGLTISTDGVS